MKSKLAEITCVRECVCVRARTEGIGQEGCPGQAEIVPLGLAEIHEVTHISFGEGYGKQGSGILSS